MRALRIRIIGSFNSFRLPSAMKYQETLQFPPRTTLIGLAGAALGKAPEDLGPLYETLRVAVVKKSLGGRARDLWSIAKLKRGSAERAVVLRELLVRPVYDVFYACTDDLSFLGKLLGAFQNPAFACTLGRSDELVLIDRMEIIDLGDSPGDKPFRETVLPFDFRSAGCQLESGELRPGFRLFPPRVYRLPESFAYTERGRRVQRFRVETHVFNRGIFAPEAKGVTDGESVFVLA